MLDRTDTKALQREAFRRDVIAGLSKVGKTLPARWLYDDRGSELFEEITRAPEYYPTRTETAILTDNAQAIAGLFGERAVVLEYGAGAGIKTEIVLAALARPRLYVPIDISGDFLKTSAERIRTRFPGLAVEPVTADFTEDFELPGDLPKPGRGAGRRGGFFPGSTIGNLDRGEATAFLKRVGRHVGPDGVAVIGCDLKKDIATLVAAYDDAVGVTAAFNLNILRRINRELSADIPVDDFVHEARWNAESSAIEMHLVAKAPVQFAIDGREFRLDRGETIHTENSRKYDVDSLSALAEAAGWRIETLWTDERKLFAVMGLVVR
ncbi:L-histidine N(alpha)-methyltransferase [Jiella endophytica]|uniref:L-histidine N(Alpha)-methyltransferase n=1 Tax=Jiella endophytica TaxID=2558362 RepID=A0A4Y8R7L2_9HYPH|nr:L-histidine N(alpha)-methyltransferase [Jiella endophytica]TFF17602.1 L-histidine N(alpha)-methyltransferase [Jiella endophytica]